MEYPSDQEIALAESRTKVASQEWRICNDAVTQVENALDEITTAMQEWMQEKNWTTLQVAKEITLKHNLERNPPTPTMIPPSMSTDLDHQGNNSNVSDQLDVPYSEGDRDSEDILMD